MTDTTQVVVRLPVDMAKALRERAAADERTVSGVVRLAVRQYLERTTT